MNIGVLQPRPTIMTHRPVKVTANGNLYKIPLTHQTDSGEEKKFEVWATKEAIQKQFVGLQENPREYQMRKFARLMYEKSMRKTSGNLQHSGVLVTTDSMTHGNPKLWPNTLSHPEIKY
jgi:hypothetical protein